MPNWCENSLLISGRREELEAFRNDAVGNGTRYGDDPPEEQVPSEPSSLCFHALVPVPADVLRNPYGGPEKPCGYDWEAENWGCKWGASHVSAELVDVGGGWARLTYTFLTPWGPPRPFLLKASKLYPMLTLELTYREAGMGFIGIYVVRGGRIAADLSGSYYYGALLDDMDEDEEEASE